MTGNASNSSYCARATVEIIMMRSWVICRLPQTVKVHILTNTHRIEEIATTIAQEFKLDRKVY